MQLKPSTILSFNTHARRVWPQEACGLVVGGDYVMCDNVAEDPETNFLIARDQYLKHADGLQAVLHSHAVSHDKPRPRSGDPRSPSLLDMQTQQAMAVPWGISATEGENVTPIIWLNDRNDIAPLIGRPFVWGIWDCFALGRDFYKLGLGIDLPDFAREFTDSSNMYITKMEEAGFSVVTTNPPDFIKMVRPYDGVLMRYNAAGVNHCAVYLGDDKIAHHLSIAHVSQFSTLTRWLGQATHIIRYKDPIAVPVAVALKAFDKPIAPAVVGNNARLRRMA